MYQWVPRKEEVVTCAGCRSPFWNKPRLQSLKVEIGVISK